MRKQVEEEHRNWKRNHHMTRYSRTSPQNLSVWSGKMKYRSSIPEFVAGSTPARLLIFVLLWHRNSDWIPNPKSDCSTTSVRCARRRAELLHAILVWIIEKFKETRNFQCYRSAPRRSGMEINARNALYRCVMPYRARPASARREITEAYTKASPSTTSSAPLAHHIPAQ